MSLHMYVMFVHLGKETGRVVFLFSFHSGSSPDIGPGGSVEVGPGGGHSTSSGRGTQPRGGGGGGSVLMFIRNESVNLFI